MSRRKDGSFVPRECKLVSVAMERALLNGRAKPRKTDRVEGAQRRSLERARSR